SRRLPTVSARHRVCGNPCPVTRPVDAGRSPPSPGGSPVGFKQTSTHRPGKGSYHQIGLVRGQFGGGDFGQGPEFRQGAGFDGYEEATWEGQFDIRQGDTDAGAAAYAKKRHEAAKAHGLEIFTLATHLQGQVLGDEPSAKTLNFCRPGEARAAYKAWRGGGNNPPPGGPDLVPEHPGKLVHEEAQRDLQARVPMPLRLSQFPDTAAALAA